MEVLDLCCGAFGAGVGYHQAGHNVTGWDVKRRRDLPPGVTFHQGNALRLSLDYIRQFDFVHTSWPCQLFTRASTLREAQGKTSSKLNLIPEGRQMLIASGVPYVMENVPEAPMRADLLLCGSMFPELRVEDETGTRWLKRHRIFEFGNGAVVPEQPTCDHKGAGVRPLGVYASKADNIPSGGQTARTLEEGRQLMGISWMSWSALVEAIPPAYTKHIGLVQGNNQ